MTKLPDIDLTQEELEEVILQNQKNFGHKFEIECDKEICKTCTKTKENLND